MKINQKICLSIIIAIFLVLFAGMIIISIPNQKITAKADDNAPPFMGQDANLTLLQKSSAISYPTDSTRVPMLTVLIPDINEDASAWSKDYLKGVFSYNAEYLPEQIESTYSNAEIYSSIYDMSALYITRIHDSYFPKKVQEIESTEEIYTSFTTKAERHRVLIIVIVIIFFRFAVKPNRADRTESGELIRKYRKGEKLCENTWKAAFISSISSQSSRSAF